MDPRELQSLDHATLYRMRVAARDRALQDLLAGYEQMYARSAYAPESYRRMLTRMAGEAAARHGLAVRPDRLRGIGRVEGSLSRVGGYGRV